MTSTGFEWREWYEWREGHVDPSPEVRFMIVCEGSYSTSFTSYYEIDEAPQIAPSQASYEEFVKAIPKVHEPFLMGSVTIDREGQVTIRPRYRETMIVDVDTRKVTLRCRCRTARGECKYQQTLSIDFLVVALAHIDGMHPDIRLDHQDPALIITWSVSEYLVGAMDADVQTEYDTKKDAAIAAYLARRKPEIVTDKKGQVVAITP